MYEQPTPYWQSGAGDRLAGAAALYTVRRRTKRCPAMDFEPGGVIFWDETISSADENILKQRLGIVVPNKRGIEHAIHL